MSVMMVRAPKQGDGRGSPNGQGAVADVDRVRTRPEGADGRMGGSLPGRGAQEKKEAADVNRTA